MDRTCIFLLQLKNPSSAEMDNFDAPNYDDGHAGMVLYMIPSDVKDFDS